jgi:hypothetical protein
LSYGSTIKKLEILSKLWQENKGGKVMAKDYRRIYTKYFGEIRKGYVVHHIDHDKNNNKLKNLVCIPVKIHGKYHHYSSHLKFLCANHNTSSNFLYELKDTVDRLNSYMLVIDTTHKNNIDYMYSIGLIGKYMQGEI